MVKDNFEDRLLLINSIGVEDEIKWKSVSLKLFQTALLRFAFFLAAAEIVLLLELFLYLFKGRLHRKQLLKREPQKQLLIQLQHN